MKKYCIITDSSCDLSDKEIAEFGISVLPLAVSENDADPIPNNEINVSDFYANLRNKGKAQTSAVNAAAFRDFVEPMLKEGTEVLYLGFSSALSATVNNAMHLSKELLADYPDARFVVVDTLCASRGQGLLVYLCSEKKKAGASLDEVVAYALELRPQLCHWFTVEDLFFLKRGGRVSGATAVLGTLLNIKPVMHMDDEGRLTKVTTAKGRKKSIDALLERMKDTAIKPEEQVVFISHGDCAVEANALAREITETFGCKVYMDFVGPVIGAHSGPGTMALFFLGTER